MKKIAIFAVALFIVVSSNAQIGGVLGKKLKEKAEQTISNAIGNKDKDKDQTKDNDTKSTPYNDSETEAAEVDELTPEKVISMVPAMPNPQQVAEYLCESHRANPRTLKMMTNPTTLYLTQLSAAGMGGYAAMASQYGRYYDFDDQLLDEFGISREQYDAMSEQEQKELAMKYAAEMEDRYYKTIERLGNDEGYNELIVKYNESEDLINRLYSEADSVCRALWNKKFDGKDNVSDDDRCGYFRQVVPDYYQTVVKAMRIRKTTQLLQAQQIDEYVKALSKRYPNEIYAGLYSQSAICATAYVTDAARITAVPTF